MAVEKTRRCCALTGNCHWLSDWTTDKWPASVRLSNNRYACMIVFLLIINKVSMTKSLLYFSYILIFCRSLNFSANGCSSLLSRHHIDRIQFDRIYFQFINLTAGSKDNTHNDFHWLVQSWAERTLRHRQEWPLLSCVWINHIPLIISMSPHTSHQQTDPFRAYISLCFLFVFCRKWERTSPPCWRAFKLKSTTYPSAVRMRRERSCLSTSDW